MHILMDAVAQRKKGEFIHGFWLFRAESANKEKCKLENANESEKKMVKFQSSVAEFLFVWRHFEELLIGHSKSFFLFQNAMEEKICLFKYPLPHPERIYLIDFYAIKISFERIKILVVLVLPCNWKQLMDPIQSKNGVQHWDHRNFLEISWLTQIFHHKNDV